MHGFAFVLAGVFGGVQAFLLGVEAKLMDTVTLCRIGGGIFGAEPSALRGGALALSDLKLGEIDPILGGARIEVDGFFEQRLLFGGIGRKLRLTEDGFRPQGIQLSGLFEKRQSLDASRPSAAVTYTVAFLLPARMALSRNGFGLS